MTKAYSYIRFSTDKQELGDSLRRQTALADAYALEHHLELVSDYSDLGVSAFKGLNSEEGALSEFIKAVDAKKIKTGSYLLVESLDRLSRQSVDLALEQFMGITRRGIVIVTMQDKQVYSRDSIRENWTKLIMALAVMARANEESATKSKRVSEAWKNKRANGAVLTKMCPAWLSVVHGKFVVDAAKAAVVQRIFQLAYDGNGTPSIAKMLNADEVPRMGKAAKWSFGLVAAILKNDGVTGTLVAKKAVAEDIKAYYPKIVEPEIFDEVNKRVANRQWKGGRNSAHVRNLLSGLCICSACGSSMRSVGSSNEHTYLQCLNAYSGAGCGAPRVPLLAVEQYLMQHWVYQGRMLRVNERREADINIGPLLQAENAKDALDVKIRNLTEAIEAGGGKSLGVRQRILEEERDALEVQIEQMKKPVERVSDLLQEAHKSYFEHYDEIVQSGDLERIKNWRTKTQAAIRRFMRTVKFDANELGYVELTYTSGTVRRMDYRAYIQQKGFQKGNKNGINRSL